MSTNEPRLPPKLLVVDDDRSVLEAVSLTLARAGYQVETTSDVLGLPLRIPKLKLTGVLLDFDLPALRGDQLAANLVKLKSTRDLTIVFHSAEDEDRLRQAVRETGVAGHIRKGQPRDRFLAQVRAFFGAPGQGGA